MLNLERFATGPQIPPSNTSQTVHAQGRHNFGHSFRCAEGDDARSNRVVVTAATLASVMNVWHAGAMRRVHGFGVSCVIRGVSGTLVGSSSEVSDGDATLGWPWDAADRVFGPYGVGMILIGMPGIEKRLARYPQFYSRIGFVHEFRTLAAAEIRQLFDHGWMPSGVNLPKQPWDPETVAMIIRMTGGNFRLLNRLLNQIERVLEINALREVTRAAVEAARQSLVIGEA